MKTYNLLVRRDGEWHLVEIFVPECVVADVAEEDVRVEES